MSYAKIVNNARFKKLDKESDFIHTPSWKLEDGNIKFVGEQGHQESVFTTEDYGSFRLFVTMRITQTVTINSTHLAVMLWGKRKEAGDFGSKGFVSIIPPRTWMWDYRRDEWFYAQKRIENGFLQEDWNEVEILADLKTGTIRTAVNGKETVGFTYEHDLNELVKGPIAFQQHWDGIPEYKDIYIEVEPEHSDRLLSVEE